MRWDDDDDDDDGDDDDDDDDDDDLMMLSWFCSDFKWLCIYDDIYIDT